MAWGVSKSELNLINENSNLLSVGLWWVNTINSKWLSMGIGYV